MPTCGCNASRREIPGHGRSAPDAESRPARRTARVPPGAGARRGRIVRAAIHPAIGIARVGNSPDEYYFGPEVDEPAPPDGYKDAGGAIKRQAARFRVYGYNAAGERGRAS